jgi:hypothetical protein
MPNFTSDSILSQSFDSVNTALEVSTISSTLPTGAATEATLNDVKTNTANHQIDGFRSSDSTSQPLRLDSATNTLQVIDYAHHEIHAGSHFFYMDYDNDVDTGTPKYYRLTTPNTTKWSHVVFLLYSEGIGTWQLFENPTVNAAGTAATVFNSNRNSATAATLVIAYDATSTADGTLLKVWRTGSGTTAPSRIGGETSRESEVILKQGEDYFLKFTPDADNAKIKIEIDWYEHTNIA